MACRPCLGPVVAERDALNAATARVSPDSSRADGGADGSEQVTQCLLTCRGARGRAHPAQQTLGGHLVERVLAVLLGIVCHLNTRSVAAGEPVTPMSPSGAAPGGGGAAH